MDTLREQLHPMTDTIVGRWFDESLAVYSPEAIAAWLGQRDRFANPVGHGHAVGIRALFDQLLNGADDGALRETVDEIVRIRAVQEMAPSSAVSFLLPLKTIVREELGEAARERALASELGELDARIDRATLVVFDLFMEHRERICELRIAEVKRSTPWWVAKAAGRSEQPAERR